MKRALGLIAFSVLLMSPTAGAKIIRSAQDLKFFEVVSPDRPPRYLGFTSSKLDNVVEVPGMGQWYIRPDGRLSPDVFQGLLEELKSKRYPGLDLSDRWDVTNAMLAPLRGTDSLRILKLSSTKITDEGLQVLDALPKLEQLSLSHQTTNKGLKRLQSLKRLRALELHRAKVTDSGLTALEGLPQLEMLDLSNSNVTDAGIKTLIRVKSLKYLDLSGTAVTDRGIALLKELPSLQTLYLNMKITDRGLMEIAQLKKLETLDISGAAITAAGLWELKSLRHLQALALSETPVGDEAMDAVAQMKSLKTLEISGTRVGADGLETLTTLPRLEVLSVSWLQLSGPDVAALREMTRLQKIILNGRTVDRETLSHFKSFARKKKPAMNVKGTQEPSLVWPKAPEARRVNLAHRPENRIAKVPSVSKASRASKPYKRIEMPRDLPSSTSGVAPIFIEREPQGKGMVIEVAARPVSREPRYAPRLTGLKRLHQLEMNEPPADIALQPGAEPVIGNLEADPKNSLGEINVQAR